MKLSSLLPFTTLPFIATGLASASLFPGFEQQEKPLLQPLATPVPGESPLVFCGATADDILQIEYVNIAPNPPLPGTTLRIKAAGTVKERIEEGAYIKIEVKYGYIKLLSQQLDLCENASQIELKCPIEKGDLVITKDVELPKAIPPGKYKVMADVYSANDEPITCLSAEIVFHPGK